MTPQTNYATAYKTITYCCPGYVSVNGNCHRECFVLL